MTNAVGGKNVMKSVDNKCCGCNGNSNPNVSFNYNEGGDIISITIDGETHVYNNGASCENCITEIVSDENGNITEITINGGDTYTITQGCCPQEPQLLIDLCPVDEINSESQIEECINNVDCTQLSIGTYIIQGGTTTNPEYAWTIQDDGNGGCSIVRIESPNGASLFYDGDNNEDTLPECGTGYETYFNPVTGNTYYCDGTNWTISPNCCPDDTSELDTSSCNFEDADSPTEAEILSCLSNIDCNTLSTGTKVWFGGTQENPDYIWEVTNDGNDCYFQEIESPDSTNVTTSNTAPTNNNEGDIWIDNSTAPSTFNIYDENGNFVPIPDLTLLPRCEDGVKTIWEVFSNQVTLGIYVDETHTAYVPTGTLENKSCTTYNSIFPICCNDDLENNNPNIVNNITAWVEGDDETSIYTDLGATTNVTANGDQVGAVMSTTGAMLVSRIGNEPVYLTNQLNGLSAIQFDDANDDVLEGLIQPASTLAGTPFELSILVNVGNTLSGGGGFPNIFALGSGNMLPDYGLEIGRIQIGFSPYPNSIADGSGRLTFRVMVDGSYPLNDGTEDFEIVPQSQITDGQPHLITAMYDGTTINIYVDGVLELTMNPAVPLWSNYLRLGRQASNGAATLNMTLYEYIQSSGNSLPDTELINNYISCKWGVDYFASDPNTELSCGSFNGETSYYQLLALNENGSVSTEYIDNTTNVRTATLPYKGMGICVGCSNNSGNSGSGSMASYDVNGNLIITNDDGTVIEQKYMISQCVRLADGTEIAVTKRITDNVLFAADGITPYALPTGASIFEGSCADTNGFAVDNGSAPSNTDPKINVRDGSVDMSTANDTYWYDQSSNQERVVIENSDVNRPVLKITGKGDDCNTTPFEIINSAGDINLSVHDNSMLEYKSKYSQLVDGALSNNSIKYPKGGSYAENISNQTGAILIKLPLQGFTHGTAGSNNHYMYLDVDIQYNTGRNPIQYTRFTLLPRYLSPTAAISVYPTTNPHFFEYENSVTNTVKFLTDSVDHFVQIGEVTDAWLDNTWTIGGESISSSRVLKINVLEIFGRYIQKCDEVEISRITDNSSYTVLAENVVSGLPKWRTANRPSSPCIGLTGINIQTMLKEQWDGTNWVNI